jgi:hypothetical protein
LPQAGHLLARLKLSSAHAVDAFVVATALQFDTAVIATGDPDDIRRLAAPFPRVGVLALRFSARARAMPLSLAERQCGRSSKYSPSCC